MFDSYKDAVEDGDLVIVFMGHDSMIPVTVSRDRITQTKFGALKHSELIGHKMGTKFHCTRGWVYILNPTPELWTVSLPHRTQILYTPDIAMIVSQLELKPGSVVCESGTGSGSLSHAIIRTIAPKGHLHTCEFNEGRYEKAKSEFKNHRLDENVTVYHRDVINCGFPIENKADAVFLDLPSPHLVIQHAVKALKPTGGRICTFSPCMEQTQRTCAILHRPESGFYDVETIEIVQRSHNVKRVFVPVADLGENDVTTYGDVGQLPVGEVVVRTTPGAGEQGRDPNSRKKRKVEGGGTKAGGTNSREDRSDLERRGQTPSAATKYAFSCRTCVLPKEIYGHTGYLTFASYVG